MEGHALSSPGIWTARARNGASPATIHSLTLVATGEPRAHPASVAHGGDRSTSAGLCAPFTAPWKGEQPVAVTSEAPFRRAGARLIPIPVCRVPAEGAVASGVRLPGPAGLPESAVQRASDVGAPVGEVYTYTRADREPRSRRALGGRLRHRTPDAYIGRDGKTADGEELPLSF